MTLISTSPFKKSDAQRLGADDFLVSRDGAQLAKAATRFDFILEYGVGVARPGGALAPVAPRQHARATRDPVQAVRAGRLRADREAAQHRRVAGRRPCRDAGDARLLRRARHRRRGDDPDAGREPPVRADAEERVRYRFSIDLARLR